MQGRVAHILHGITTIVLPIRSERDLCMIFRWTSGTSSAISFFASCSQRKWQISVMKGGRCDHCWIGKKGAHQEETNFGCATHMQEAPVPDNMPHGIPITMKVISSLIYYVFSMNECIYDFLNIYTSFIPVSAFFCATKSVVCIFCHIIRNFVHMCACCKFSVFLFTYLIYLFYCTGYL